MEAIIDIFESVMVICFGISWPLSIMKSWKARTAKGKSLLFLCFIETGYLSGIAAKLIGHFTDVKPLTYVVVFYILNFIMVGTDIILYFRNRALDREAAQNETGAE